MANTPRERYPIPNVKGFTEIIRVADPGAGNNFTLTLPQIENTWRYKVLSVHLRFATDATVIGRSMGLRFHDLADTYDWFWLLHPVVQTASLIRRYMFAINFPAQPWWATGNPALPETYSYLPLPDVEFTNLHRLSSDVGNMQLDDITRIAILIRRWIDDRD